MDLKTLRESEYRKCAGLLAELLDLDGDTKEKIQKCFQRMGIRNFFRHLESADLAPETSGKLQSIQVLIEILDDKRGRI
ncbi:hypothetical protein ABDB91_04875 [Desulfoscipio sp. XC116]|uniref:hypothetical protein n=1 Tax=Desulfoscipio sp. XC116 TaxID=3144975 RepID=UPI00325A6A93